MGRPRKTWLYAALPDGNNPTGGGDPTGGGGTPPADPPKPAPPAGGGRTFTQEEVNSIATREAEKAARKALADLRAAAGLPEGEKVEDWVKAQREKELAAMTEAERAKTEAAALLEKAKEDAKAAAEDRHIARITSILGAGVHNAPRVAMLVEGVTPESTDDQVRAAVEDLRKNMPGLFLNVGQQGPGGDPGRPPAGGGTGAGGSAPGTFGSAGREEALRRYPRPAARQG